MHRSLRANRPIVKHSKEELRDIYDNIMDRMLPKLEQWRDTAGDLYDEMQRHLESAGLTDFEISSLMDQFESNLLS